MDRWTQTEMDNARTETDRNTHNTHTYYTYTPKITKEEKIQEQWLNSHPLRICTMEKK